MWCVPERARVVCPRAGARCGVSPTTVPKIQKILTIDAGAQSGVSPTTVR